MEYGLHGFDEPLSIYLHGTRRFRYLCAGVGFLFGIIAALSVEDLHIVWL